MIINNDVVVGFTCHFVQLFFICSLQLCTLNAYKIVHKHQILLNDLFLRCCKSTYYFFSSSANISLQEPLEVNLEVHDGDRTRIFSTNLH